MKKVFLFLLLAPSLAFAAGTVTVTRTTLHYEKQMPARVVEKVTISWVGDASTGSVPSTSIVLKGFVEKAITIPGSPNPTASYAVAFDDPDSSSLDAFASALTSLSASASAQKAVVLTGAQTPVFLDGTYTFALTGNSVASAQGQVILYLTDRP
jgi:hypothetical protein